MKKKEKKKEDWLEVCVCAVCAPCVSDFGLFIFCGMVQFERIKY